MNSTLKTMILPIISLPSSVTPSCTLVQKNPKHLCERFIWLFVIRLEIHMTGWTLIAHFTLPILCGCCSCCRITYNIIIKMTKSFKNYILIHNTTLHTCCYYFLQRASDRGGIFDIPIKREALIRSTCG